MNDKLSKTYCEVAQEWQIANGAYASNEYQIDAVIKFAKYLDSFQTLSDKLQILAIQKAREIDREVLLACVDKFGLEEMQVVIQEVYNRHKHTKTPTDVEFKENEIGTIQNGGDNGTEAQATDTA